MIFEIRESEEKKEKKDEKREKKRKREKKKEKCSEKTTIFWTFFDVSHINSRKLFFKKVFERIKKCFCLFRKIS